MTSDKPTVLFIDEIDALVGDTLISVLRQLRAGYTKRPVAFPQCIILCGVRDVRDYRIHQGGGEIITGGSAFNIKTESLRMGNFSQDETKALWLQHTEDTGQAFDDAIFPELWEDTCGQPWLVNALGYGITWKLRQSRDRSPPDNYRPRPAAAMGRKNLAPRRNLRRPRHHRMGRLTRIKGTVLLIRNGSGSREPSL